MFKKHKFTIGVFIASAISLGAYLAVDDYLMYSSSSNTPIDLGITSDERVKEVCSNYIVSTYDAKERQLDRGWYLNIHFSGGFESILGDVWCSTIFDQGVYDDKGKEVGKKSEHHFRFEGSSIVNGKEVSKNDFLSERQESKPWQM